MDDDAQNSSILGLRGFISSNFGGHKSLLSSAARGYFCVVTLLGSWVAGLRGLLLLKSSALGSVGAQRNLLICCYC